MNERESTQRILEMHKRNLAILEEQLAAFGEPYAPPHIKIQIQDKKKIIAELESTFNPSNASITLVDSKHPEEYANTTKTTRSKVFISYSPRDSRWLERLKTHLMPQVREGKLEVWDDTKIKPGMRWREEIQKALDEAKVIVMLISADFLASDFYNEETPRLLAAAEKEGAVILPLIIGYSRFTDTPLYQFQAINSPEKPLSGLRSSEQDEVLVNAARAIDQALKR
ncbi:toll/interleukin-1 receptor domain-containing protein [Candidatus Chlorohelix sp.]|uniref:toll/interleukin-1 receptor domain-containing protein n=1 Tax=Candidatus Chlorohelix sp. TaxID=3139201 RepID=UPI0030229962